MLTGEVLRTYKLPSAEGCFDLSVATDGKVYLPGYHDYRLWVYDPVTKEVTDYGEIDPDVQRDYAMGCGFGPNNTALLGTYSGSRLHSYDPATGVITNLGTVNPEEDYIHFIGWDPASDAVFCATGGVSASIWRIEDGGFGAKSKILDGSAIPLLDSTSFVGMLDCVNGHLVSRIGGAMIVTDLEGKVEYWNGEKEIAGYHVAPALDGSGFYFSQFGTIQKYEFATHTYHPVAGEVRSYFAHAVEAEPGLIVGSDQGGPFTVNIETGERTEQNVSFRQPTLIQKIFPGPGDSMYASGYMLGLAEINKAGGEPNETLNSGQYESWLVREDKMYLAAYAWSKVYEWDPEAPATAPKQLFTSADENFDRPFGMAYNPERDEMYVGSVPAYGGYQGGLAIYSFATGEVEFFGAEIAENQGIVSAVWNPHDKLLYLGTTIDGGMGTNPTSITDLGQLVVFDPETRTVVRSGAPVRLRKGVTGLLVDPDGSVWGVAEEQLMKVSPDGTVRTLGAVSGRYADPPAYTWAWAYLNWSARDGMIYGSAGGNLFKVNPQTEEITRIATGGAQWAATDAAGDVYFSYRTHCFTYVVPQPITAVDEEQKCLAVRALQQGRTLDTSSLNRGERAYYDKLAQRLADGKLTMAEEAYCRA
ncbi:hypothetical protein [Parenemella sanctibonifatiensis]|uniref:Uncharacterized protein n=1 Tax=Parenemella sanctibonifatiensis TaxID=2016505 RepID=A0A255E105_9ACTN|nr:hypothetical protein [Parenemella sanctibonifatiensis]OYN85247.1 hypothetical protein CGZ92_10585 [Parenemella sanctibonifatiensis]